MLKIQIKLALKNIKNIQLLNFITFKQLTLYLHLKI
jgi:hypothetical protein